MTQSSFSTTSSKNRLHIHPDVYMVETRFPWNFLNIWYTWAHHIHPPLHTNLAHSYSSILSSSFQTCQSSFSCTYSLQTLALKIAQTVTNSIYFYWSSESSSPLNQVYCKTCI